MILSRAGIQWIEPEWPAPPSVRAISTLRSGGVSHAPFDSLNLASHVGDDPKAVNENRRRLKTALRLPNEPCWLQQVHGTDVVHAHTFTEPPIADAVIAKSPGQVCVVMTADCLPVLFCNRDGSEIAAAHAGWRGLVGGVLENTVHELNCDPAQLLVWLGPAIGCSAFEVGEEVREAFVNRNPKNQRCFTRNHHERWTADLGALARNELARLDVRNIFTTAACTVNDASQFFSYRRDGQTGRMASMIWLQS
jgi:YfiH family protein